MKINNKHNAIINNTTVYKKNVVRDVKAPYKNNNHYPHSMIKESTNIKLGKKVLKGLKKGYKVYTFALVERETCTNECEHYITCYGNNMPFGRFIVWIMFYSGNAC